MTQHTKTHLIVALFCSLSVFILAGLLDGLLCFGLIMFLQSDTANQLFIKSKKLFN